MHLPNPSGVVRHRQVTCSLCHCIGTAMTMWCWSFFSYFLWSLVLAVLMGAMGENVSVFGIKRAVHPSSEVSAYSSKREYKVQKYYCEHCVQMLRSTDQVG